MTTAARRTACDDMRCMIEARLEGGQPIAVTHQATTLDESVDGAADKFANLIESTLGRQYDQELRRMDPPLPEVESEETS